MDGLAGIKTGLLGPDAPHQTCPPWYVVHTRSRYEVKVHECLCSKALESFLPLIEIRSRRRDRRKFIKIPLFPGYLFVRTVLEPDIYHEIIKTKGIVRIVGFNNHFSPVEPGKVESIQLMLASGRPLNPWASITKGKPVRIIDGPLRGAEGIVVNRKDQKRRLVVTIDLLKRSVAVELDEETVEPLSKSCSPGFCHKCLGISPSIHG